MVIFAKYLQFFTLGSVIDMVSFNDVGHRRTGSHGNVPVDSISTSLLSVDPISSLPRMTTAPGNLDDMSHQDLAGGGTSVASRSVSWAPGPTAKNLLTPTSCELWHCSNTYNIGCVIVLQLLKGHHRHDTAKITSSTKNNRTNTRIN